MVETWIGQSLHAMAPRDGKGNVLPGLDDWVHRLTKTASEILPSIPELALSKKNGAPDKEKTVYNIVAAAGVGWMDSLSGAQGAWKYPWPRARAHLAANVRSWVRASEGWLDDLGIAGFRIDPATSAASIEILTDALVAGFCCCYRRRFWTADLEAGEPVELDANTRQRARRCLREHHLAGWNPSVCSLENFIGQAMKGPLRRFNATAFEGGMVFDWLYRENHLRFGDMWAWTCKETDPGHVGASISGQSCPVCGCAFDERMHPPHEKRAQFYVLVEHGGNAVQEEFWRCAKCRNLAWLARSVCPICDYIPMKKRVIKLTRAIGSPRPPAESAQPAVGPVAELDSPSDSDRRLASHSCDLATEEWKRARPDRTLTPMHWRSLLDQFGSLGKKPPKLKASVLSAMLVEFGAAAAGGPDGMPSAPEEEALLDVAQIIKGAVLVVLEDATVQRCAEDLRLDEDEIKRVVGELKRKMALGD